MTSTTLTLAKLCSGPDWAIRQRSWRKKNRRAGSFRFFSRRIGYGYLSGTGWKKRRSTISYKLYMKMLYKRLVSKKRTQE